MVGTILVILSKTWLAVDGEEAVQHLLHFINSEIAAYIREILMTLLL